MKKDNIWVVISRYFYILAVWGVVLTLLSCQKKIQPTTTLSPKVEVSKSIALNIPIQISAVGHVTAYNSAQIKPQIEGELLKVHFQEGDQVKKGELLFTVDPRSYQADLLQAESELTSSEAKFQYAKQKLDRYSHLIQENYVSQLNYEGYLSDVQAAEAAVLNSRAKVDRAAINLNYCFITAPFDGIVGKRLVDVGNLVTNNGSTLAVVNQLDPIFIDFTVSEKDFYAIRDSYKKGTLFVEAMVPNSDLPSFKGKLTLIDNQINESTGMIRLRSECKNINHDLWPGQFVRINLVLYEKKDAVVVPVNAVNLGQKGHYVVVIDENQKASIRSVVANYQYEDLYLIEQGVHPGEVVVVQGQLNVRPGDQVSIKSVKEIHPNHFKP